MKYRCWGMSREGGEGSASRARRGRRDVRLKSSILIDCVLMRGEVVYIQERVSMYVKGLEACRTRSDVATITGRRHCVRIAGVVGVVVPNVRRVRPLHH